MLKIVTLVSGLVMLAGGCHHIEPATYPDLTFEAETSNAFGWGEKQSSVGAILAEMTSKEPDVQEGIFSAMIVRSDSICERYMGNVITSSNTTLTAFDVSALAFGTAGGIASPGRSANVLSNLATFATGTKGVLSDNILGGNGPALIYKSVMTVRKKEHARLEAIMKARGAMAAARQVQAYHGMCGPTVAVNGLDAALENSNTTAGKQGTEEGTAEIKELEKVVAADGV